MKKKLIRGFTLIELMIVVAIIGILAAVAIPAFIEYMRSGKGSEVDLALNRATKGAKTYRVREGRFPAQTDDAATPNSNPCDDTGGKYAAGSFVASAGGNFEAIEFTIEDAFRFDYSNTGNAGADITFTGVADLDCDVAQACGGGVGCTTAEARVQIDGTGNPYAEFMKSGTD